MDCGGYALENGIRKPGSIFKEASLLKEEQIALPVTADGQALAEQLILDLENNPAIVCPINFIWQGSKELADIAGLKLRLFGLLMRKSRPSMSFQALKVVTFHHDYDLALSEAVDVGRKAPIPTKGKGGIGVAMMVQNGEGVHLVFHESIALDLVNEDPARSNLAQHIVRHELCHVDDFAFQKALLAKNPESSVVSGFDSYFFPPARAIWDEFYANKYSFGHWSDPQVFLDLLSDSLPVIKQELVEGISNYRNTKDLWEVLAFAAPKVRFVAQCFGYAAGTLAAMGTTLEEEAPGEYAMLTEFGLSDAWEKCFEALLELDRRRPYWDSLLDLKELFPGCQALFAGLGFHYSPYGEGAWVDIP